MLFDIISEMTLAESPANVILSEAKDRCCGCRILRFAQNDTNNKVLIIYQEELCSHI